jgi:hypothetical protein
VTTTIARSVYGVVLFVLTPLACSWDAPPVECSWVEARRFTAPAGACTRYEVTDGKDSCVRRADEGDECTCTFELTVEPGAVVVYSYDYYEHDGDAGLSWSKVPCP